MRCPSLNELPVPEIDKYGWPWTEETPQLVFSDCLIYIPKISIVTPSYNQGHFIEETIRSVLLQGYPDLEYVIVDGGSTDNTIDIIKKYEPWLSYWISEPDNGQSNAINKGMSQVSGEIIAWINSDDYYCKNSFLEVYQVFAEHDALNTTSWLIGNDFEKNSDTNTFKSEIINRPVIRKEQMPWSNPISQPSVFWSSSLKYDLDESLHYAMDWDLWNRFIVKSFPILIEKNIAVSRIYKHTKTKTGKDKLADELYRVSLRYGKSPLRSFLYRYALWEPQFRGAGNSLSVSTLVPKVWRKAGRALVWLLCGKKALEDYSWNFCA